MDTTHHEHRTEATQAPTSGRPIKVALAMVALIGAFYLLREHWDHVAGASSTPSWRSAASSAC